MLALQYMHDKSAIAFDGNAHKVVGSMKKPQVSHDIGNRLNGGSRGQNTIGGAHLYHVGFALHT